MAFRLNARRSATIVGASARPPTLSAFGRDLIADLLDRYGETVRWLVVRNLRDSADSSVFMASKTRQRLLALDIPEHVRLGRFL